MMCIKFNCIKFVFVVFFVVSMCLAGNAFCQHLSPAQIVSQYVEADYDGVRVSYGDSSSYTTKKLLASYTKGDATEGGYDTTYIIDGYRIIKEQIDKEEAFVDVEYDIVGEISADSTRFERRKEVTNVDLIKVDGEWRLLYPITPPRISIKAGIKDTKRMSLIYKNATDAYGMKVYRQLVAAVKKLEILQGKQNMNK